MLREKLQVMMESLLRCYDVGKRETAMVKKLLFSSDALIPFIAP